MSPVVWRRPMEERRTEFRTTIILTLVRDRGGLGSHAWHLLAYEPPCTARTRVRFTQLEVDANGCLVAPEVDR